MRQCIPLDLLLDYARCPLLYWWRRRAQIEAPPAVEALPERAVRQGLTQYYEGRATSVLGGCVTVWRGWLEQWQCPQETMDRLQEYVEVEARLLSPLLDGAMRWSDGTPPDLHTTQLYKERAGAAGLPGLERKLEQAMGTIPLIAAGEYSVMRALSDTISMALCYKELETGSCEHVQLDYAFEIAITAGILVTGLADLVVLQEGRVKRAEVHDYGSHRPPVSSLSRHLNIIALVHAEGEGWRDACPIIYRHMPTGFSTQVYEVESCERLLPVIAAALRGVQCGVFLPRIAVAERDCLHCAYYGLCVTQDGLDVLDDLDATLVALDEA